MQDPGSCSILFLNFPFSRGMLEILFHVTATLSWDHRDLGSETEKMWLDPADPESCYGKLSGILRILDTAQNNVTVS